MSSRRVSPLCALVALILVSGCAVQPKPVALMKSLPPDHFLGWTSWSPEGSHVLVGVDKDPNGHRDIALYITEVRTGKTTLFGDSVPFSTPVFSGVEDAILLAPGKRYDPTLVLEQMDHRGKRPVYYSETGRQLLGAALSPDGKSLAAAEVGGKDFDDCRIYLTQTGMADTFAVIKAKGLPIALSWSPDSRRLVWMDSVAGGDALKLMEMPPKKSKTVIPPVKDALLVGRQCWSADSSEIVGSTFPRSEGMVVWAANVATGKSRVLAMLPSMQYNFGAGCSWSPDGQRIAFGAWADRTDGVRELSIYTVPATGGAAECVMGPVEQEILGISWSPDSRAITYVRGDTLELLRMPRASAPRRAR